MSEQTVEKTDLLAPRQRLSLAGVLAQVPAFFLTLDGASLAIMWLAIAIARVVPQVVKNDDSPAATVSILALPLLVILPRQIGVLARPLLRSLTAGASGTLGAVEQYVVTWLTGIWLLVLGLIVFTGVIGVPAAVATGAVLAIATASSCYYGVQAILGQGQKIEWRELSLAGAWPAVAALVLVSVPLVLVRLNQPYPLQVGWGLFGYSYRILQFVKGDHIALVAGLHTPIHAGLFGVAALAADAEVAGLIWAAPLLLYLTYGLGVYLFARALLRDSPLSLLALWVAAWVLSLTTFQHLHAVGMRGVLLAVWPWVLLVLYRQLPALEGRWQRQAAHALVSLAAVFAVIVVRSMLPSDAQVWGLLALAGLFAGLLPALPRDLRQSIGIFTLLGATLTFFHAVEGPMFFGLGVGFLVVLAWRPVSWQFRALLAAGYVIAVGFILLQVIDVITFDDPSMISRVLLGSDRADAIPIPFDSKMNVFKEGMTYPIMGILAFSALRSLIWPNSIHLASMAAVAAATVLFFLPESGLHRTLGPSIPFIGVVIALEVAWIAQRLLKVRWSSAPAWATGALALAALIALTPTLTSSLSSQLGLSSRLGFPVPKTDREFSSILSQEYRAGEWIAENIPADWAIVSDPATMFVMEGMTFHPQVIEKRRWVAESEYRKEDQERLRSVFALVFGAPTEQQTLEGMSSLTQGHEGAVLIFSNRTLMWLADPSNLFALGRPLEFLMEREPIQSFCGSRNMSVCPWPLLESPLFTVVYNQEGIAVLVASHQLEGGALP